MNKRTFLIIFIDIVIVLLFLTNKNTPGETIEEKISKFTSLLLLYLYETRI